MRDLPVHGKKIINKQTNTFYWLPALVFLLLDHFHQQNILFEIRGLASTPVKDPIDYRSGAGSCKGFIVSNAKLLDLFLTPPFKLYAKSLLGGQGKIFIASGEL